MRRLGTVAGVAGLAALLLSGGCAGVISKQIRQEAVPVQGLSEIRERPEAFQGKTVILGGEIIGITNEPASTTLEVLDRPLDWQEQPEDTDVSGGRFEARVARYLDPAVFSPGRQVTVAGVVTGTETKQVGKARYRYVVLEAKEVYLWRRYRPYPYYYDPWYPYGWYDPFWGSPWWWNGWPPPPSEAPRPRRLRPRSTAVPPPPGVHGAAGEREERGQEDQGNPSPR